MPIISYFFNIVNTDIFTETIIFSAGKKLIYDNKTVFRFVLIFILFSVILSVCAGASALTETETTAETTAETTVETTTELNEPEPETEVDTAEKTARDFLNINIYLFAGAVVLVIVCTVIHFILRAKKRGS